MRQNTAQHEYISLKFHIEEIEHEAMKVWWARPLLARKDEYEYLVPGIYPEWHPTGPVESAKIALARFLGETPWESPDDTCRVFERGWLAGFMRRKFGAAWWVPEIPTVKDGEIRVTERLSTIVVTEFRLNTCRGVDLYDSRVSFGDRYRVDGNYEEALEQYNRAIPFDFTHPRAYIRRSQAYMKLESFGKAISDCDTVVKTEAKTPYTYLAYILRGKAYQEVGEYREAEEDYNNAIGLYPDLHLGGETLDNLYREMAQVRRNLLKIGPDIADMLTAPTMNIQGNLKDMVVVKDSVQQLSAAQETTPALMPVKPLTEGEPAVIPPPKVQELLGKPRRRKLREILKLLVEGLTYPQIAFGAKIGESTVKENIKEFCAAFGEKPDRRFAEAMVRKYKLGLPTDN